MLSAEQSKAILEGLQRRSADSGVLERHVAVEEALTETPLSLGNKVTLLEDGPRTYAAMLEAIRGAKRSVHLESYIIEADEVGQRFADALVERARAGVKVRLIYDSVGSKSTPADFFKAMTDGGVEVVEFHPIGPGTLLQGPKALNHRDHRKLTVVDGRVAFLGGINISSVYASTKGSSVGRGTRGTDDAPIDQLPWRDTQARLEGPVVADLQRAFLQQWAKARKEPALEGPEYFPPLAPQGNLVVRAIAAGPDTEKLNALYVALISAIDHAEREVRITNAYFVPHPQLLEALKSAARRGVDVKLILPSRTDSWLVFNAGRSYYEDLLETGVRIYERKRRVLHSKTATIDGVWSTVGSTNLDWRSLVDNDELNAVVLGPEFAAQMNAIFDKDLADSKEITRESWRGRPIQDRLREAAARAWSRLL